MTSKTSAVAIVPPPDSRDVTIDRTVVGAPAANLTNVVGELMGALKSSLSDKDDVTVEVAAHTDATRSSAHVKIRGYRHRTRDDAAT